MPKTANLKVAPNHILHISRHKERFVHKTSVETDNHPMSFKCQLIGPKAFSSHSKNGEMR